MFSLSFATESKYSQIFIFRSPLVYGKPINTNPELKLTKDLRNIVRFLKPDKYEKKLTEIIIDKM